MKKNYYTTFIFVVALGFFYVQITKAQTTNTSLTADDSVTTRMEFKKPINLDTFLTMETTHVVNSMILESNFVFNGEEIQDFYVVDTKDKNNDIKADYIKSRKGFIIDVKKTTELSPINIKNIENILITKVTLTGKKSNLNEIKKGLDVNKVDATGAQPISSTQTGGKVKPKEAILLGNGAVAIAAQTQPMYLSLPASGTAYFYPSASGGRYTQQNMRWSANYFTPEETYEHKVYLYNYDRKTYLDGTSTLYPRCYPTTTYAATTWPVASYPYLDTRLSEDLISCEIDELSYTIGAAQASAIPVNVNHYTYIRTADGNDTTDKFKLQGQVGYRYPSICYTTWCSKKYKIYTIIPFLSGITVPGTQSWNWYGQAPEAPSNVLATNPTAASLQIYFTDNTYDETNILIERKTGVGGSWILLGGFGILNKTGNWYWNNTGLTSKTTHCYRLKAVNAIGNSPYSNESCGTTL